MNLQNKLLSVQEKLKVPKSQLNKFGGYKYRNAEDIMEAVKPLLAEEELLMTVTDQLMMIGERYYVQAKVVITDGENEIVTRAYAREAKKKKGMDASQITGAASSYARKYALNGMFAIDDTKDADTTNTHGKGQNKATDSKSKYIAKIEKGKQKYDAVKEFVDAKTDNLQELTISELKKLYNDALRQVS